MARRLSIAFSGVCDLIWFHTSCGDESERIQLEVALCLSYCSCPGRCTVAFIPLDWVEASITAPLKVLHSHNIGNTCYTVQLIYLLAQEFIKNRDKIVSVQ